ncbi:MAG: TonB-dependent receptor plug domain-containing protein, partial [Sphingobacteriaceae bacterium]
NSKFNYLFNYNDILFLSVYFGKDKYYFRSKYENTESKAGLDWGNATSTLRWNHLFNSRLFSNASLIYTNYKLGITNTEKYGSDYFTLNYKSNIRDVGVKYNFDFIPNPNHYIKFGVNSIWHNFIPQALVIKSSDPSSNLNNKSKPIDTFESGVFIEDDWKASEKLRMNLGIRVSAFSSNGDNFFNPEPRASLRYLLGNDFSLKTSYALMNQYLHLLSNTGIGLPTDLWVPATNKTKPQQSQQIALGLAKDLTENNLTITVEGYYKWMKNVLNYKEGASFFAINDNSSTNSNVDWQNNVVSGKGWSYGGELLIQKKAGKFTGWIGYTLSWTWLQFDSLNFGEKFHPRFDRRHDISLVGMYKINDRINLAGTWVYGTGNAITLPLSSYAVEQNTPFQTNNVGFYTWPNSVNDYGKKNSFRMAPYHRLDFGIQFHKQYKKFEKIFEFSIYNVYSRQNPFFYYSEYSTSAKKNKLMQVSLFPILPSVSWTFKF